MIWRYQQFKQGQDAQTLGHDNLRLCANRPIDGFRTVSSTLFFSQCLGKTIYSFQPLPNACRALESTPKTITPRNHHPDNSTLLRFELEKLMTANTANSIDLSICALMMRKIMALCTFLSFVAFDNGSCPNNYRNNCDITTHLVMLPAHGLCNHLNSERLQTNLFWMFVRCLHYWYYVFSYMPGECSLVLILLMTQGTNQHL